MRKSNYDTRVKPHLDRIKAWARDGIAEKKMREELNVSSSAWEEYKNKHPELKEILARTRDFVDNVEMVNAYKQRAEGYTTIETRREYAYLLNPQTMKRERILVKEIEQEKHVPGDPRAMENWLRLRQKATWGGIEVSEGKSGVVIIPAKAKLEPPKGESDE